MKGFSSLLLVISGVLIGPPLVALTNHFIPGAPDWFPYVIILLVAGVTYAVGVLRGLATGIVIGVIVFAVAQVFLDLRLTWLPEDLREVPPPF